MRKDERLRTIYETIAPHITRTESAWREYLSFAARFHKYGFDNALLIYAQNPNVTMLATTPIWNKLGRYVNKGASGMAVCEYGNAKLTIKHLFDISQTNGKSVAATNWQLDGGMKEELTARLSYSNNLPASDFSECLSQIAQEAVSQSLDDYLQDFDPATESPLFSGLPHDGLMAAIQGIIMDSVIYFIGKRCDIPDEEINTGDGMATIAHFDSIPLIARLGHTVTDISKGVLLEVERTIKIIENERKNPHEQSRNELYREGRGTAPEHSNLEQQRGRQPTTQQIRQDGDGLSSRQPSTAVYDFENGWHTDGEDAPRGQRSGGEARTDYTANASDRPDAGDGGHHGENPPPEQHTVGGRGNHLERDRIQGEINTPIQTTEPPESEKSLSGGSFFVPETQKLQGRWADRVPAKVLPVPLIEGVPSKERVSAVSRWIKENSDKYNPVYAVMYHATDPTIPILEQGLLPTSSARRRSYQSTSVYVYLANTPKRAKAFGDLGNGSVSTVYEVIIPINKLSADLDQLNNQRSTGVKVGNSLAESIVYGGGARVKGKIEPWQIQAFDFQLQPPELAEAPKQTDEQISGQETACPDTPLIYETGELVKDWEDTGGIYVIADTDENEVRLQNIDRSDDTLILSRSEFESRLTAGLFSKSDGRHTLEDFLNDPNIVYVRTELANGEWQCEGFLQPEDGVRYSMGVYPANEWPELEVEHGRHTAYKNYLLEQGYSENEATEQAGLESAKTEYTDEQVRQYYEKILTSTGLYPLPMYDRIQNLFASDISLEDKADGLSRVYEEYGDAEYQADVPLRTTHRGKDGMSFFFGDGYTHLLWHTVAHIVENLIDEGEYPAPLLDENLSQRVGGYNIPDEIDEMDDGQTSEPESLPNEPETINVLVVEPGKKPYPAVIPRGLEGLRGKVGGNITTIEVEDGIDAICSDDLPNDAPINRMIKNQPVFGTFVLAGVDEGTGRYQSLKPDDIEKYTAKFAAPLYDITKLVAEYEEMDEAEENGGPDFEAVEEEQFTDDDFAFTQPGQQMTLFDMAKPVKSKEDEYTEVVILQGSHVEGGKQRIYDFAMTNPTGSAFAKMLKKEYGIGGGTVAYDGIGITKHDGKGIEFDWTDEGGEKRVTHLTWVKTAGIIHHLIQQGRYLKKPSPVLRTVDKISNENGKNEDVSIAPDKIEVQIKKNHLGYHDRQNDFGYQAVYNGVVAGVLEFSEFEEIPHISNIEVLAEYRRRSVGTQLIEALQNEYPSREIEWGFTTEDGTAFKNAVTYSVENEEYTKLRQEHEQITGKLSQLEDEWSDTAPSDDISDFWNGLSDRQQKIEEALDEEKPQRSFVRTPEQVSETGFVMEDADIPRPRQVKNNFRYSEDYNLYPNGEKTKYKNNVTAIRLLKKIEEEKRLATPDEQIVLARYVGWGGIANAFSDTASGWENEYQELKHLLTDTEYVDARNSTITAYYTEPELIRHIYKAIERFGFQGGPYRKLLDPGMGTGLFYSVLPENLADTKLYGVELDSITGRIAKQLYQNVNIQVKGYENTRFEDNSFDVAIGNIPFNNVRLYDKRYADNNFLIHDYFIAKTLDLVKPGGIIGFITSKGTMDKRDSAIREYIVRRADLIGAIRLPNTAFKALAGTEVTADILFLQKKKEPIIETRQDEAEGIENDISADIDYPDWVFTDVREKNHILLNQYFINHPEMMLGEMEFDRSMYGAEDRTACIPPEGQDLYAELERAIGNLHADFDAEADQPFEDAEEDEEELKELKAPEGTKNYTYVVQDGQIYYCEQNRLKPQDVTGKRAERIKGLCEIRTALLEVIRIQTNEYTPDKLHLAQRTLNEVYDRFTLHCGAINDKANTAVFSDDDQFPLLRSIEDQSKDKKRWSKAPVFYKATIKSYRRPTHADTAKEALEISLNLKMKIDLPYMASLTGKSADELIDELGERIYLNPQKYYGNYYEGWELNEEYLSGQVRDKLLYAKQKAEENPDLFTRNVQALEAVQPVWLQPSDINFRIGSPWIPLEYFQQFMYETFGTPTYLKENVNLDYMEYTTTWRVNGKTADATSVKVNNTYGTKRVNAYEIFEDCLNLQSTTVRDPVHYTDKNGKDQIRYVVNANETMIARAKQSQIREAFSSWLFKDKVRAEILLKIYNEKFNTIRPRVYDGNHLVFPGMSEEMQLRPHQKNFAARVIYSGTGLAGHVVGAGKTAAMIAAGMYLKNIGAIKKPVYVVPNHLTEQWAKEFYRFFPQANILVTTKKDFEAKNRNKFVSKIAMGEYDAVIIGHSQFERIPISKERQEDQLNSEINKISFIIKKIKEENGENWAVKQMVIFQTNLMDRLTKLSAEGKKDDLLTFEQLGVDCMFVDEAHVYKNCFTYTKMRNVAGIGKGLRKTDLPGLTGTTEAQISSKILRINLLLLRVEFSRHARIKRSLNVPIMSLIFARY